MAGTARLKKQYDSLYSQYIRRKYADGNGYVRCVTCGCKKHWKDMQAGHYVPRKYLSLRYSDDNVFPQCVGCNIFRKGNMDEYALFLVKKFGKKHLEKLAKLKNQITKLTPCWYAERMDEVNDLLTGWDVGLQEQE